METPKIICGNTLTWQKAEDIPAVDLPERKLARYLKPADRAALAIAKKVLSESKLPEDFYSKIAISTCVGHNSYFPELFWNDRAVAQSSRLGSEWFSCMYSSTYFISKLVNSNLHGVATGPTSMETAQMLSTAHAEISEGKYALALVVAVSDWTHAAAQAELNRFHLKLPWAIQSAALLMGGSNFGGKSFHRPALSLSWEKPHDLDALSLLDTTLPISLIVNSGKDQKLNSILQYASTEPGSRAVQHFLSVATSGGNK